MTNKQRETYNFLLEYEMSSLEWWRYVFQSTDTMAKVVAKRVQKKLRRWERFNERCDQMEALREANEIISFLDRNP